MGNFVRGRLAVQLRTGAGLKIAASAALAFETLGMAVVLWLMRPVVMMRGTRRIVVLDKAGCANPPIVLSINCGNERFERIEQAHMLHLLR